MGDFGILRECQSKLGLIEFISLEWKLASFNSKEGGAFNLD